MLRTISNRHLNTILVLVMLLGTATLAILALAAITFAAVLIHTAIDSLVEVVQTVSGLYTHGDPLTRLFILGVILLLCWKAAPPIVRYVRRQVAAAPTLFARQKATRSGPAYVNADQVDEDTETEQDDAQPDNLHQAQHSGPTTTVQATTNARKNTQHGTHRPGSAQTIYTGPAHAKVRLPTHAST